MKLPLLWMMDYLPVQMRGEGFSGALAATCRRWDLQPHNDVAKTLAQLLTFAGFNCDGVHGSGLNAVLELDVLSNRPDGQCIVGLAREVAAMLHVDFKAPPSDLHAVERGKPVNELAAVRVDEPELCPRYTARVITGVKVGPSPQWLKDRLGAIGLQPRNNIVDVTNFICFELNQPLHAFDLRGLDGRQIIVRRAKDKEDFTPLYGEIPLLTPETLVIADASRPRAVAGVLGGKGSEVTEATTEILLEAAYFNPANTRRTVRRLKVMDGRGTDSSYRFERGIDQEAVDKASARAARLIVEVAGGSVAPGIIDVWNNPPTPRVLSLRMSELSRVFGAPVLLDVARRSLVAIGGQVTAESSAEISVKLPSWRRGDLEREIDLIEEVARLHGYNHVPDVTDMSARVPVRSRLEIASAQLRNLFACMGFFECVSDSLIDPKWPAPEVWTHEKPLALDKSSVLREDHSALRNSMLTSLLAVRRFNQDQRTGEARLFELGKVYLPHHGPRPQEKHVIGLVDDRGFQPLADAVARIGEALELDGAHLKLTPVVDGAPKFLAAGKACRLTRVREMPGNERAEDALGWLGVISPELQKAYDLRKPVAMCELDLAAVANLPSGPRHYRELAAFPEVSRDIAMVVDESITWNDIDAFARDWVKHEPLRDSAEPPHFLSVFRGKQAGEGKKSLAFSVQYRAADRTLTDDEVNAAHAKFQQALLERFKAALRQ